MPLHPDERSYFCVVFEGRFLVWNRVAQGSKNGPQAWGRLSAMITRLAQSVFEPGDMDLATHTDDPIAAVLGNEAETNRLVTILIWAWRCMGLSLAFRKGQLSERVGWVGHEVEANTKEGIINVTIKKEFVAEVLRQTLEIKRNNKIGRKALRSYNGPVGHISTLIWAMKPFMEELWAAAEQRPKSNAGRGLIWRRQIDLAITWALAFLRQQNGHCVVSGDLAP